MWEQSDFSSAHEYGSFCWLGRNVLDTLIRDKKCVFGFLRDAIFKDASKVDFMAGHQVLCLLCYWYFWSRSIYIV